MMDQPGDKSKTTKHHPTDGGGKLHKFAAWQSKSPMMVRQCRADIVSALISILPAHCEVMSRSLVC